ncbi:thioredoxin family protein [Clostridium estertheticum]|uniref:thioredoxin family protein n=1 Tax=Clostridium estertheticum TaxID=238834 RepID=UPI001CF2B8F4|nr:thioredoxin family protein [Clostridium estertheticum]MCB2305121.1 thioredoxin family protein [Clostridium estertheticum]MCB2343609.1 thioredoxin family protein [Clostridium estertheticum]MCB2348529.1 thioredoxin family protein [Clostridium estertheticum]WAG47473.1 thioredoxin family protein [Clostridium estertheticum]
MKNLNSIDDIKDFIKENKFVMLYFSSDGCSVCDDVLPRVEELLKKQIKVVSGHVEIQNIPSVASVFGIFTIPSVIIFLEGKEIVRQARYINFLELKEKIQRFSEFV